MARFRLQAAPIPRPWALVLCAVLPVLSARAQTPDYWIHFPGATGVNNTFFHGTVCQKFVFSYTAAEWAAVGLPGATPYLIDAIWFRGNMSATSTFGDFKVQMGHTALTTPVAVFSANFDPGTAETVLDEPVLTINFTPGPTAVISDGWTRIDLETPFLYNPAQNLAVLIEFSSSTFPPPLYSDVSTPTTWIHPLASAAVGISTTWRPMFGISAPEAPPIAELTYEPDSLCVGSCLTVLPSVLGSVSTWEWSFPGSLSPVSSDPDPGLICYAEPGVYPFSLVVSNAQGSDTATGQVTVIAPQVPDLGPDIRYCEGEQVELASSTPLDAPLWSTGETTSSIAPAEPGWYWLTSLGLCPSTDSILLTRIDLPQLDLGPEQQTICRGDSLLLLAGAPGPDYLWNTGNTQPDLTVSEPGLYTVVADREGCTTEASVQVEVQPCGCTVTVPNAFSPNADGLNDLFRPVVNCAVTRYRLQVWNRWGESLFLSFDPAQGWDGTFRGNIQDLSAYIWHLEIEYQDEGQQISLGRSGTLTLLP